MCTDLSVRVDSMACRQQCKTRPSFKCIPTSRGKANIWTLIGSLCGNGFVDSNGYRARGSIVVAVLISFAALLVVQ